MQFLVELSMATLLLLLLSSSSFVANSLEISKITIDPYVYFIERKSWDRVTVEDMNAIYKRSLHGFLYLHLKSFYYVDHVDLTTDINANTTVQLEDTSRYWYCNRTPTTFDCKRIATSIIILGITKPITKLEIYGYETHFYNYAGCFESKNFEEMEQNDDFHGCSDTCATTFYGFNSAEKCVCIDSLSRLSSTSLQFCDVLCPNKSFIFCGGDGHISVYSKKQIQIVNTHNVKTFLDCLVTSTGCPICKKGRRAQFCQIIDCSINNGSCGDQKCEFLNFSSSAQIGLCLCSDMFHYNLEGACQVDQASLDPGMEGVILISLILFLVLIIFFSIYILSLKDEMY